MIVPMTRLCWLLPVILLVGCTSLPPQPFTSPIIRPFTSPLPLPATEARARVYLPLLTMAPFLVAKKGLAGGPCRIVEYAGAAWYYGWNASGIDCRISRAVKYQPGTAWFVPMIWGPEELISAAGLAAGNRIRVALGPNEPDRPDQANMTPAEVAVFQRWMEQRYASTGWHLVAPAISTRSVYLELVYAEYLRQYGEAPQWQALALHCYRPTAQDCIEDISYYVALARKWNLPGGVWVTEFGFHPCWSGTADSTADMVNALRQAETLVRWLEATPEITAYAWFVSQARNDESWIVWSGPHCGTRLYDPVAGRFTTFGEWYRGTPWPEVAFQAFLTHVIRDGHTH
jgi:Glycosyl hydrolase catalytic core